MDKRLKYENYQTYKGIECLNSCIYNYILNKGFNISRSDIFFLGHGLDITYTGYPGEKMIYSRQYESNYEFLRKFMPDTISDNIIEKNVDYMSEFLHENIPYSQNVSDDRSASYSENVSDNKSIIIQVSSASLPYNKVFSKNDTVSHFINILKYDDVKRQYYISDGCPPTMSDEVWENWISEDMLLDNWSSMGGKYIMLNFNNNKLNTIKDKSVKEFASQLKTYLHGKNILIKNRYKGHRSAITLLKDMQPLFENNVSEVQQLAISINRQFKINGFLQSKEFILDKAKDLSVDENICGKYTDIINEWNKQMLLFIKAGISISFDKFKLVLKDIEELTENELKILEKMYAEIRNKSGK